MKLIAGLPILAAAALVTAARGDNSENVRRADFAVALLSRIEAKPNIRGDDQDWFFLVRELRHLASGRFWEKPWEEVAANRSDPTPGILEFRDMLAARGMRLVLVPVPAKASIYPGKFAVGFGAEAPEPVTPFLDHLRKEGVDVLDPEPTFRTAVEAEPGILLYCRRDAHFSPVAAERIAALIAETLGVSPVEGAGIKVAAPETISFVGDQVEGSEWEGSVPPETLPLRKVADGAGRVLEPDAGSPVLLLGDSHTLVFQAGEENGMHCRGAGVFDHLAAALGYAPDLVGVRGSGLVQARKQLFYKASATPDYWALKKTVIWLFSVREFTQSSDRPVSIPLDRSPPGGAKK